MPTPVSQWNESSLPLGWKLLSMAGMPAARNAIWVFQKRMQTAALTYPTKYIILKLLMSFNSQKTRKHIRLVSVGKPSPLGRTTPMTPRSMSPTIDLSRAKRTQPFAPTPRPWDLRISGVGTGTGFLHVFPCFFRHEKRLPNVAEKCLEQDSAVIDINRKWSSLLLSYVYI